MPFRTAGAALALALFFLTTPARAAQRPGEPGEALAPSAPTLTLGGALRTNLQLRSWEPANISRLGVWAFDTLRLDADGRYQAARFSAEYRFYQGYQMLHHGWIGADLPDGLELRLGVTRVPFGILPYASHNWFFGLPYYLGLEDDYDMGLTLHGPPGALGLPIDWHVAFFKNDEGSYTGKSLDSARYSYDVVRTGAQDLPGLSAQANSEVNQLNVRAAVPLGAGEIGVSGRLGGLYNGVTGRTGLQWAAGLHYDGTFLERLNLMAEGARYGYQPANPAGADDRVVTLGAYDAPYMVAASANVYLLGVSYRLPVTWGALSEVLVYDDASWVHKDVPTFAPSRMNVLGARLTIGPIVAYVDLAAGQNHPWLGPDYATALAQGQANAPWHARFNINLGYYF